MLSFTFGSSKKIPQLGSCLLGACCDLQGRKINFTNSRTLVARCRDRPWRSSPLLAFLFLFSCVFARKKSKKNEKTKKNIEKITKIKNKKKIFFLKKKTSKKRGIQGVHPDGWKFFWNVTRNRGGESARQALLCGEGWKPWSRRWPDAKLTRVLVQTMRMVRPRNPKQLKHVLPLFHRLLFRGFPVLLSFLISCLPCLPLLFFHSNVRFFGRWTSWSSRATCCGSSRDDSEPWMHVELWRLGWCVVGLWIWPWSGHRLSRFRLRSRLSLVFSVLSKSVHDRRHGSKIKAHMRLEPVANRLQMVTITLEKTVIALLADQRW